MVKLENVFLVLFPRTRLERVTLRDIDLSLNEGEVTSILGHNGSGRSTLLQLLAGHITPNFGRILLNDVDITNYSLAQKSKYFSTVFFEENTATAGNLTILENLVAASMHHQSRSLLSEAYDDNVRELFYQRLQEINFMKMEEIMDEKVCDIPAHYRQVLALLIAVMKEAKVLLIDEPSTGLDEATAQALFAVTENIIKTNHMTTLMCVNDPAFALKISDKIAVLNHGQLVATYEGKEIKNITPEALQATFDQKMRAVVTTQQ
ncbi:MAG: ATP-binding cassette domain-containing protein [Holosporaceae bacterium]|jgi:putative ABC transport system ATP-binding protein|nr:ATP-binding cassette domain-containing protein [Holosporaceae bacterium]